MKKILLFMIVGLLVVQAQADLILTGGNLYADASENNTTFADGTSPWSTPTGGTDSLWWMRTGFGYNDAGEYSAADADICEAIADTEYWRSSGPVQGLKTTVTGLVEGEEYAVYVVYASKNPDENWNVTADFSPITNDADGTVTSGITYGAADATLYGVSVLAGEQTGDVVDAGGNIYQFRGLVGIITGTASGTLDVYVDDISDLAEQNFRSWYEGILLVPEPTTMILLGLGGLLIRRKS